MPELEKKECAPQPECCCGPRNHEIKNFRHVGTTGNISTKQGDIGVVTGRWSFMDHLGAILVRMGFFRMNYAVKPGLYATGRPNDCSPVFVSANYKLSLDILRRDLAGIDGWILVLDTKGVNVWCAAGKGTFGTKELVARIIATGLCDIVSHRNLVVPQLGAPGVSAFKTLLFSSFNVIYGPVRSADIKDFMANGMKADSKMRKVNFWFRDRLTVSALELVIALEKIIPVSAVLIAFYAFSAGSLKAGFTKALLPVSALLLAALTGTVFVAGLLPYLPGKAFSIKGAFLGAIAASILLIFSGSSNIFSLKNLSIALFVSAVSAHLALNFTGSSTFTSLSGVKKEIRLSLPVIIGAFVVSIITYILKGT